MITIIQTLIICFTIIIVVIVCCAAENGACGDNERVKRIEEKLKKIESRWYE